jgi:glutathione reductase (NADPH)
VTTTPDGFDLVVIGTGEGGTAAATRCRAAGWRVAVVDDQPYGGTCALRGCDPKKVLVGAAEIVDWAQRMRGHGITGDVRIDWGALMQFKQTFTDPVPTRREDAFDKAGIVTLHGEARFTGDDRMVVTSADGELRELHASHFLIASGAEPVPLHIPGEAHVRTSTDFLDLDSLPARIAFIGGGYISFEFAHIAKRARAQAIVLGRGAPLQHFDQDLVARLVAHSRDVGIEIRTDTDVTAVEHTGTCYRVHTRTDGGSESGTEIVEADLVVHGAGRVPKTGTLDLACAHVAGDERGGIVVNEFLQSTTNPRVYAAGDCTLPPGSLPLTPVAAHEGLIAASNLLRGNAKRPDYRGVASAVFTIPPLAMVGMTEAAARAHGLDVRVKCEDTASWFSNRRVQEPAAMFKTIVDKTTNRVLGAHLLGPDAADVINFFALAVRQGLTAADLKHMIYAYPTSSSDVSYML